MSVKKGRSGSRKTTLFGFPLDRNTAVILFFLALIGMIGSFVSITSILISISGYMAYSIIAAESTESTESTEVASEYQQVAGQQVIATLYIYLVIWSLVFILCIYVMYKCKKAI